MKLLHYFAIVWFIASVKLCNGYSHDAISEPQCNSVTTESTCVDTNGWCVWSDTMDLCIGNYNSGLFVGAFSVYPTAIPMAYGLALAALWKICSQFVYRSKICSDITPIHRQKCIVYLFQLGLTSYVLIWFASSGIFEILFRPQIFASMTPNEAEKSFNAWLHFTSVVPCGYVIELCAATKMRFSLQIHHVVTILLCFTGMAGMYETTDADIYRLGVAFTVSVVTEQSVFIQLLLYRMFPKSSPICQWIGVAIYIVTRVLNLVAIGVSFVQWGNSRFIPILFGSATIMADNGFYTFYFLMTPTAFILFFYTYYLSASALIHMAKSRQIASVERRKLTNPRIRKLRSIFERYIADDGFNDNENIYDEITFEGWTNFVNDCDAGATLIDIKLLFEAVGCDAESGTNMKWRTFRKLFCHSLMSTDDRRVRTIVRAKLRLFVKKIELKSAESIGYGVMADDFLRTSVVELAMRRENVASLLNAVPETPLPTSPLSGHNPKLTFESGKDNTTDEKSDNGDSNAMGGNDYQE